MFENILLPTDGSECSKVAGNHAIEVAKRYDSKLHILSVVSYGALDTVVPEVMEKLKEAAEKTVDESSKQAKTSNVKKVKTSVQKGPNPTKSILKYIDDNSIDLIVMGTHGRTGLDRYLIGSTTEKVMRETKVPVMTVPKNP